MQLRSYSSSCLSCFQSLTPPYYCTSSTSTLLLPSSDLKHLCSKLKTGYFLPECTYWTLLHTTFFLSLNPASREVEGSHASVFLLVMVPRMNFPWYFILYIYIQYQQFNCQINIIRYARQKIAKVSININNNKHFHYLIMKTCFIVMPQCLKINCQCFILDRHHTSNPNL